MVTETENYEPTKQIGGRKQDAQSTMIPQTIHHADAFVTPCSPFFSCQIKTTARRVLEGDFGPFLLQLDSIPGGIQHGDSPIHKRQSAQRYAGDLPFIELFVRFRQATN